jgi:hypothetical protein
MSWFDDMPTGGVPETPTPDQVFNCRCPLPHVPGPWLPEENWAQREKRFLDVALVESWRYPHDR